MRWRISLTVLALAFGACGRSDLLVKRAASGGTMDEPSEGSSGGTSGASHGGSSAASSRDCGGIDTQNDLRNCGACGVVCAADAPSKATCVLGRCLVVLAERVTTSQGSLAVGRTDVYWTSGQEKIMKIPLGGGTPSQVVTGSNILRLAVDANNLYWTDNFTGEVMKMPLLGRTPTVLASKQHYLKGGLAVDATNVYWTTWPDTLGPIPGTLKKVPINGGAITTLASGLVAPANLAVNATNLYWTEDSAVMMVPIAGGAATTLASNEMLLEEIAADANNVYFAVDSPDLPVDNSPYFYSGSEIMKVPGKGSAPSTMIAQRSWGPFVVDDTNVYFASGEFEVDTPNADDPLRTKIAIMKAPLAGGTASTVVSFQTRGPFMDLMAVDATSVYWTTADSLMKASPK